LYYARFASETGIYNAKNEEHAAMCTVYEVVMLKLNYDKEVLQWLIRKSELS